jgi:hypothetical protein
MRGKSVNFGKAEANMKISFNNNQAVVVADKVHNFGDALIKSGPAPGYTMLEIIDVAANNPAAMQIARDVPPAPAVDLSSVKAPITNPGL